MHRLTRLAVEDEITRPIREWVTRRSGPPGDDEEPTGLAYFVTCPWCVSIWLAAGWAVLTVAAPPAALSAGTVLAWSSVAGLISSVT